MTFITGSITNANPGPALYAAMEPALLAAGYTLVDTVVIGTRTHKVLKSPAASNSYNLDWYLDVSYPTTGVATRLMMAPFEGYDAVSDLGYRGPYAGQSAVIENTYYSRYGAVGYALETNWANSSTYTELGTDLTTSTFVYWVSVTPNRVILMVSNNNFFHYCGFFTPTAAHASAAGSALFPLVTLRVAASGSTGGSNTLSVINMAVTRLPKVTDLSTYAYSGTYGWSCCLCLAVTGQASQPVGGAAGVSPHPMTGEIGLSELVIYQGAIYSQSTPVSSSSGNPYVAAIGKLDGIVIGQVTNTSVRGDMITVGSDTWYANTRNTYVCLFMQGV